MPAGGSAGREDTVVRVQGAPGTEVSKLAGADKGSGAGATSRDNVQVTWSNLDTCSEPCGSTKAHEEEPADGDLPPNTLQASAPWDSMFLWWWEE